MEKIKRGQKEMIHFFYNLYWVWGWNCEFRWCYECNLSLFERLRLKWWKWKDSRNAPNPWGEPKHPPTFIFEG